jgi:hypothetical protein
MKVFSFLIVPIFVLSTHARATILSSLAAQAQAQAQTRAEKKMGREISRVEEQLRKAIVKRDVKSLDKLLAEYYADSKEGSERATGKKAALEKCKAGRLPFYEIEDDRKLTFRGSHIVQVEGMSMIKPGSLAHSERSDLGSEAHVVRLWSRESGRWSLISQTVGPAEEEGEQ